MERRVRVLEKDSDRWLFVFSALTVLLTGLAIFIGVATLIGWGRVKAMIRNTIDDAMSKAVSELSGRLYGVEGLLFGRVSRDENDKVNRWDLLDSAIYFTIESANELEPLKDSDYKWRARNNLAFYLALRGRDSDAREAIRLAELLRKHSTMLRRHTYLETYALVVATFSAYYADPFAELQEAAKVMDDVMADPETKPRDKASAERTRKLLGEKLTQAAAGRKA